MALEVNSRGLCRGSGQRGGVLVVRGVSQARLDESLASFDAGATGAAMSKPSLIAGPGSGVVDVEFMPQTGNRRFVQSDEGAKQLDPGVSAFTHSGGHGLHEGLPAIWVNGMVTSVGRNQEAIRTPAFRESGGDREHDGVAERHDGTLHGLLRVMSVGDGVAGLQKVGCEELIDEGQRNDVVPQTAEMVAVPRSECDFPLVVLGAVVKTDRANDLVMAPGPIKRRDGVHAAR